MAAFNYYRLLEKVAARKHLQPSVAEMRQDFARLASMFPLAGDILCESQSIAGVPAEWIRPPECEGEGVVLYLHGGGYVIGSIRTHREMVSRIARASGRRCLVLDYRLAPENPFPAALEDVLAVYEELVPKTHAPAQIVFAGDSAGAGLAVAALAALRDRGIPLPAAAACISPWVDLEGTGKSVAVNAPADPFVDPAGMGRMAKAYLGSQDPRTPYASPIHADMTGFGPLLVQVGTAECLLDDAIGLARRAEAAGVAVELDKWDGMVHMWQYFASVFPPGQSAIEKIGMFIRRHLDEHSEWVKDLP